MPFEEMLKLWLMVSGQGAEEFWKMSLREYQIWMEGKFDGNAAISRQKLEQLMERFSDEC